MDIYEKALSLLKLRPHTAAEIKRKLLYKGYNAQQAGEVTLRLAAEGLINDRQFAEEFLHNQIRYKVFGYHMLLAKLLQRGIERALAKQLLDEMLDIETETKTAQKFVEREKETNNKLKLAQKLSRKGFRQQVIFSVIEGPSFDQSA